ncbi:MULTISPECIES: AraC family transcriptional regulator [Marinobacter]|uniref:AraC family transcriptional regulator n=1 Tax=Marinobacter xiaoshiensis TaxID=3073652 RepID=A0ABU2HJB2_9GAMM|nr:MULTISPECIES: AraC family transcriptional regulator [unclassified Marinobacter]MBK1888247.1 AraC family transcriptional regulator [Marinobacter sp. DY40_1A1]MDS1310706.1 AraC family transcriptional regulator [Marinobacter sp. F60267]
MINADPILHPIVISQVMINFAASLGVDKDACLQGTGITDEALMDGEALIARDQEMRLIENLILALPDTPALGLKLGMQYNVATFGIWGFALSTSRTLRDAAKTAIRYLPLSTAYCRLYSFDEDGFFGIGLDPASIPPHVRQFLLERDLATGVNLVRELSLSGLAISKAEFEGLEPAYSGFIEEVLGVNPAYNSQRNAIMVAGLAADKPLPTFNARLVRMLNDQCRLQLEQRQTSGLSGLVRQQILGPLGLVATLDEVASALAMSSRSLRRKLEQEGTSFRALVDEERRQTATQILSGSDMKLDELAIHLGYTDTASFTRAFRRWMGVSPGEYRKTNVL